MKSRSMLVLYLQIKLIKNEPLFIDILPLGELRKPEEFRKIGRE